MKLLQQILDRGMNEDEVEITYDMMPQKPDTFFGKEWEKQSGVSTCSVNGRRNIWRLFGKHVIINDYNVTNI